MNDAGMDAATAQNVGGLIGMVGIIAGAAYGFIMRHKKKVAENKADVAASEACNAVADAQATAYNTITDRMRQMEQDVQSIRAELAAERKYNRKLDIHNRKLEIYIIKLVAMLKAAGIEIPPMETLPELDLNDEKISS